MAETVVISCLLLVGGMSWGSVSTSQEHPHDIPLHARRAAGEQGWACDSRFRQLGRLCVYDTYGIAAREAVEVFNKGWRCRPGYRASDGFCVSVPAPRHALLVGYGDRWECERGFRKAGRHCEAIRVPPHGHLDQSGHGWVCDIGFHALSEYCVPVSSPAVTVLEPHCLAQRKTAFHSRKSCSTADVRRGCTCGISDSPAAQTRVVRRYHARLLVTDRVELLELPLEALARIFPGFV